MDGRKKVREWAAYLRAIRNYFESRGFLEVTTDHVVPAGAFESTIDTLAVSWRGGKGELHTSPEIEMKALLAEVRAPIYQVCQCFRDDPPTGVHRREFTMLEFYRTDARYRDVLADVEGLVTELAGAPPRFETRTFRELVLEHAGVDISADEKRLKATAPIRLSGNESWNDIVFKLLVEKVEPALDPDVATFVVDYPASMAALGAVAPDGTVAERFELYWRGMEICNGCTELGSLEELRARIESERSARETEGKNPHPVPARLIATLEKGLPPCAGVAIGLERLFECLAAPVGAGA